MCLMTASAVSVLEPGKSEMEGHFGPKQENLLVDQCNYFPFLYS